jgi:hypothetical protein
MPWRLGCRFFIAAQADERESQDEKDHAHPGLPTQVLFVLLIEDDRIVRQDFADAP